MSKRPGIGTATSLPKDKVPPLSKQLEQDYYADRAAEATAAGAKRIADRKVFKIAKQITLTEEQVMRCAEILRKGRGGFTDARRAGFSCVVIEWVFGEMDLGRFGGAKKD